MSKIELARNWKMKQREAIYCSQYTGNCVEQICKWNHGETTQRHRLIVMSKFIRCKVRKACTQAVAVVVFSF